jgi:hypothetical protein
MLGGRFQIHYFMALVSAEIQCAQEDLTGTAIDVDILVWMFRALEGSCRQWLPLPLLLLLRQRISSERFDLVLRELGDLDVRLGAVSAQLLLIRTRVTVVGGGSVYIFNGCT